MANFHVAVSVIRQGISSASAIAANLIAPVAIRNTPLKGTVRVAGEVVRADGACARPLIQIAISDPGPGATLGDFERLVRSITPVEILGAEQRSGAVTMTAASGLGEAEPAMVSLRVAPDAMRTLLLTLPMAGNNNDGV